MTEPVTMHKFRIRVPFQVRPEAPTRAADPAAHFTWANEYAYLDILAFDEADAARRFAFALQAMASGVR